MASEAEITINLSIRGLGKGIEKKDTKVSSVTPETTSGSLYQVQETADTAEALNVGGIDDVEGVWIKAVDNDLSIDTSYVSSFVSEIVVKEGEVAYFRPSGTVYIKNNTAAEKCTVEFLAWGSQD